MKNLIAIIFLILSGVMIHSCGSGAGSAQDNYAGIGSRWSINLDASKVFTMSESNSGALIEGTWETAESGLKKLTITASNNQGTYPVGGHSYALDIPGVMVVVKPSWVNNIIPAVIAGECPNDDVRSNWVVTVKNGQTINLSSNDVYGVFSLDYLSSQATLPSRYLLSGSNQGENVLGTYTCANGVASVSGGVMYLTKVGAALVDTTESIIMALPATNLGSTAVVNGTYLGFVFSESSGTNELFPVEINLVEGVGTGSQIDPDTGESQGDVSISLTQVDDPEDGFITGTVGGSTIKCMAAPQVNGTSKNFVFCIGENPGESGKSYNLLMITK